MDFSNSMVRTKMISDQSNPNVFDESEYERAWTQGVVEWGWVC